MSEKLLYAAIALFMSAATFLGTRIMDSADSAIIMRDDALEIDYELRLRRNWMDTIDDLAKALEKDVERNSELIGMVQEDVADIRKNTQHIPVLLSKIELLEDVLLRGKHISQPHGATHLSKQQAANHDILLEEQRKSRIQKN